MKVNETKLKGQPRRVDLKKEMKERKHNYEEEKLEYIILWIILKTKIYRVYVEGFIQI